MNSGESWQFVHMILVLSKLVLTAITGSSMWTVIYQMVGVLHRPETVVAGFPLVPFKS